MRKTNKRVVRYEQTSVKGSEKRISEAFKMLFDKIIENNSKIKNETLSIKNNGVVKSYKVS